MVTGRAEGAVAHWRVGPHEGGDATVLLPLEVPEEFVAHVATTGVGRLTLRVVEVDAQERIRDQSVVLRSAVRVSEGRLEGIDPAVHDLYPALSERTFTVEAP